MELPKNLLPDEASPEWLNKGDNAWQLTAATLVGLQSIPGLVILYGSLVKRKWAVNSAFMAFYAFAAVLVCWVGWAYRMSFGDELVLFSFENSSFLGKPGVALDEKYLLGQAFLGMFPTATMVFFQGVFAGITLILVAGALLGRMNFRAWMLFVPLWLTLSYTVAAFSIWCPDGWLAKLGIIDFSGGYVIHLSAGVAGFTAACWVGPRSEIDRKRFPPNNIILMLAGAGLLWMGWTGFNGGGPFVASIDASLAVLNTHVCTATSLLTWLFLDTFIVGKPSVIGAVQGMITGLVCITPAAGVVQGWAAILMGLISGSVPWYTMTVLHNKVRFLRQVDDPMAVFHTHAIAGSLGGILTGIFAVPKLCRLFYMVPNWDKYIGLAYGLQNGRTSAGFRQMGIQLVGILFVVCLNIVITSLICLFIRLIVPLRLDNDELQIGDDAVHGEEAFALCAERDQRFVNSSNNTVYDAQEFSSIYVTRTFGEVQMV
ncbi:ammonium transporter 2 member 4-like [Juglans microcarpa x Juglans regia]|uniref:ammonium transporter 2 member 4-like n=1 Tax=Juglans microcarpa x Juglans regia TaxID=2249226 RepID=UPI001B7DD93F|nr:ammonium transporter 2 member 4-like [Juglans microcarpa x Juglans regia]